MSEVNYVLRHGRRIEVETLDTGPSKKIRRHRQDTFALVPLQWVVKAAAAASSPSTVVLVWLLYRSWQHGGAQFDVPNMALLDMGVSRKVKLRVLHELEETGLIKVEWRLKKSPIVTLIDHGPSGS
jgi:hypothetical protein